MKQHYYLSIVIMFLFFHNLQAQVTIGSAIEPNKGSLLDLKENGNLEENANRGLLLPRVELEDITNLYPMFESTDPLYTDPEKEIHKGLLVYNVTNDPAKDLCPGPYVWGGGIWIRLWDPCTVFEFICAGLTPNQYTKPEGTAFNEQASIQYTSYKKVEISTPQTVSYGNGLSINIPAQTLPAQANGIFIFNVQGDNTTIPGTYNLSLSALGDKMGVKIPSTCNIVANISVVGTFSLNCTGVSVNLQTGDLINQVISVPCTVTGTPFPVTAGTIIGNDNGITATIAASKTIDPGTGFIDVRLSGTPSLSGNRPLPITINGSQCSIDATYTVATALNIVCPGITPIVSGTKNVPLASTTVSIPYTLTGAPPYALTGTSVTYNGLTATISTQSLTSASGNIDVVITGTPTKDTGGVYSWAIPIGQGQKSCDVNISVTTPPIDTDCGNNNNPGVALVFSYNGKWYAVKVGVLNGNYVAALNEHDNEISALQDPEGLQFCSNRTTLRCVPVFRRNGVRYDTQFFSINSTSKDNSGVVAFGGCTESMIVNPGQMLSYQNAAIPPMASTGNLGAITVGGKLYLGRVSSGDGGIMTTKSILY